ncbi:MAG: hypothetical protein WDN28_26195 [Chthoniobacter sp.]
MSAQKVARDIPERMEIVGMSAHSNEEKLREAGKEFPRAKLAVSSGPEGVERLVELATMPEADLVLIAIVGTAVCGRRWRRSKRARTSPWRARRSSSWPAKRSWAPPGART